MAEPEQLALLRQRVVVLEGELIAVRDELERLRELRAQATLAGVVKSVGLGVALAEATLVDRAVSSVSVSAQAYLVPHDGGMALRFQPAESAGRPVGLSTTTFELAKLPTGGPALPSLYAVLEEKQQVYSSEPWVSRPESRALVAALARTLADSGAWNLPYLAEQAAAIARLEQDLVRAEAGRSRADAAVQARGAVRDVDSLAGGLQRSAAPSAGNLYALVGALHASTRAAARLADQATAAVRSSRS